jgi:predicted AAA+ superfamily ATPase
MTRLQQNVLLDGSALFKEFKGALTEQYVLQQLKTMSNIEIYYWSNERNTSEVDFLLDVGKGVIPLEVKADAV